MHLYALYIFIWICGQLFVIPTSGIKWLALATSNDVSLLPPDSDCNELLGLARQQKRICRRNTEVMGAVQLGASRSLAECQWQFKFRRWNCSLIDPVSIFGNRLNQGTREAAFVHAISAAGVAYSVTRACSQGTIQGCGCDYSVDRGGGGQASGGRGERESARQSFQWAGCSENVAYGTEFSKRFVDVRERLKGNRLKTSLMNLHNNQAGRLLLASNMQIQCKCHGVSGSCEVKTCWRQMPNFRQTGDILKDKFDSATFVVEQLDGAMPRLEPKSQDYKMQTVTDLVYLKGSPNFCERNKKHGSLGTKGRLCNKNSRGIDGCELLCCNRGFETRTQIVEERCRCKFQWCCTVVCDTCRKEIEEYFCR